MLIGLSIYSLFLVVPTQSAEVLRNLIARDTSFFVVFWSVSWPPTLLAVALTCVTTCILPTSATKNKCIPIAVAYSSPFLITALAIALAVFNQALDLSRVAAFCIVALTVLGLLIPSLLRSASNYVFERSQFQAYASWSIYGLLFSAVLAALVLPFLGPEYLVFSTRAIGCLGIIAIFAAVVTVGLALLTVAFDKTPIPILTTLLGVGTALWLLQINDNHRIRLLERHHWGWTHGERKNIAINAITDRSLEEWVGRRSDRDQFKSYPVFVFSAEGGGIYAAYHAAHTLARLRDKWPLFSEHILALSTVSGGSVGAALFTLLSQEMGTESPTVRCSGKTRSMEDLVDRFFGDDHLAPLMFMNLGPGFLQRIFPGKIYSYDSALGLEYSLQVSWSKLAEECNFKSKDAFEKGLRNYLWTTASRTPALFFNTTDEATGGPVVINTASLGLNMFQPSWDLGLGPDIRLSTAAVLSSRYPFVTSAGWFNGRKHNTFGRLREQRIFLDDGGIYENSGSELLTKILYEVKRLVASIDRDRHPDVDPQNEYCGNLNGTSEIVLCAGSIGDAGFVANNEYTRAMQLIRQENSKAADDIQGAIEDTEESFASAQIGSKFWPQLAEGPLGALLAAREYRSREALKMLMRLYRLNPWAQASNLPFSPYNNEYYLAFPLDAETPDLPLGWQLSDRTMRFLARRSGDENYCEGGSAIPDPDIPAKQVEFLRVMTTMKERFDGTLNVWHSGCSQRRILDMDPNKKRTGEPNSR